MEEEIINAKAEISNLKDKKDRLYNQMIKTLSEIYNCDLDITIIDSDEYFASKKNEVLMNLNNASATGQCKVCKSVICSKQISSKEKIIKITKA